MDKSKSSFTRNSQRHPGQKLAEWVNVFQNAVLDIKSEGLNVDLKSVGWHLFERSNLTLERRERVLGCSEGKYGFAAIRGALIKLLHDTIISQEKRSVPDRKQGHVTDRKTNERAQTPRRKSRVRKSQTQRQHSNSPCVRDSPTSERHTHS